MYKRCQILLTDWQEEYLKNSAQLNDLSFSEMARIVLSEGILYAVRVTHSGFKPNLSPQEHAKMIKKGSDPKISAEEKHRMIAKVYFEARKAAEYRERKISKQKIKKFGKKS